MPTKYMHTLDDQPAVFDGEQVCFTTRKIRLADSLNQIRREQRRYFKMRKSYGFQERDDFKMGYATVIVD